MTVVGVKTSSGKSSRLLGRDWTQYGQALTARNGGCNTSDFDKAPWVPRIVAIAGLDAADGQLLSDWLTQATAGRIDDIVDLADRSWQVDGLGAIMGVFEGREELAS